MRRTLLLLIILSVAPAASAALPSLKRWRRPPANLEALGNATARLRLPQTHGPSDRAPEESVRKCTRIQHIGATLSGAETSNIYNTIDHLARSGSNPFNIFPGVSAHMSTSESQMKQIEQEPTENRSHLLKSAQNGLISA